MSHDLYQRELNSDEEEPESDPDPARLLNNLRSLVFFDDTFLSMQAMNIAIVDQEITEREFALLREYFELEKTPTMSAMRVSALSQMWIFALYELLRTWGSRVAKIEKQHKNGQLDLLIKNLETQTSTAIVGAAPLIQLSQARAVLANPKILELATTPEIT